MSRSRFYEYKRSFQELGFEGLSGRPPIPGFHPNDLSEDIRRRVVELSLKHPTFGQQRIADQSRLEGLLVSAGSVRNIRIKEDMETR